MRIVIDTNLLVVGSGNLNAQLLPRDYLPDGLENTSNYDKSDNFINFRTNLIVV
jgi:hypothetical protein